jgi:hypothetical protein
VEIRFSAPGIVFPESVKSRRDQERTLGLQNIQPDLEMQQKMTNRYSIRKQEENHVCHR